MSVRNEKSGAVSRGDNEIPASFSFQLAPAGQPPRRNSSFQLASSCAPAGRVAAFPAYQLFQLASALYYKARPVYSIQYQF